MDKAKMMEFVRKKKAEHEKELERIAKLEGLDLKTRREVVERIWQARQANKECPRCNGLICLRANNKYLQARVEVSGELHWIPCMEGRELRRLFWLNESHIPRKYASMEWLQYTTTAQNEAAVKIAKWYAAASTCESLYLSGTTGSGKTFLASLIGLEMLERARKVYFADMPSVLSNVRESYSNDSPPSIMGKLKKADFLILDDVGASKMTEWGVGILYEIVNSRYNAGRPLIITSNYTLDDLGRILTKEDEWSGQRIISRLTETAICADLGKYDWRAQR